MVGDVYEYRHGIFKDFHYNTTILELYIYTSLEIEEECELYQIELMNNHLGVLLISLILCYCKMPLQTGHVEQGLKDQINMFTSVQLHKEK